MDQALGWLRIRRLDGSDVLFHNGGTSGFRSCVVVHQATKTSVVAMCNGGGDVSLDPATFGVLAALLAGDG
jgi:hypothetical protein